ncbi:MAG: cytochrome C554 and C-prime [Saprospiraceae bacterium]|nr:cytochrome C554 and C-prime [Saprospiraceae bacterium]
MNKNKRLLFTALLIIGLSIVYFEFIKKDVKVIHPLTQSWEIAVPHQEIPDGLTSLSAKQCGACHVQHYDEWKKSTHAHAWNDLQFQSELKKESSPFLCINCHIPLQNQQEYLIKGLEDGNIYKPVKEINPYFDKALQSEGITCAGCHVRNNTIIGSTGSKLAPHVVKVDKLYLSETLCISCHNANAVITPTLACSFETGDEWKAGPFFGKKNCLDCHMPETYRSIVTGMPKTKSRFHSFAGSGIPKFDTISTDRLESLEFKYSRIGTFYQISDSLKFTLGLTNVHAGHRVPTGDPERFIEIEIILKDTSGQIVSMTQERIGEQWEWYPKVKKISDNNLNPGESRIFSLQHRLAIKGQYQLEVMVSKHRLTPETADYNDLGSNYPLCIIVYEQNFEFEVCDI